MQTYALKPVQTPKKSKFLKGPFFGEPGYAGPGQSPAATHYIMKYIVGDYTQNLRMHLLRNLPLLVRRIMICELTNEAREKSDIKGKGIAVDDDDSVSADEDDVDMDSFDQDIQQAIRNSLCQQFDTCTDSDYKGKGVAVDNSAESSSSSRWRHAIQQSTKSSPRKAAHVNARQQAREASQCEKDARYRAKIIYNQLLKPVATQIDAGDDNDGKKADNDDTTRYLDTTDNGDDGDGVVADDAATANASVTDDDMQIFGAEVAEVLKSAKKETFYRDGLMLMHRLIGRLRDLGGEPVALVPLYHASAGYITIDTCGLYYLLRNLAKTSDVECPEANADDFARNRLRHMPKALTIPRKLFLWPEETVVERKTYFRNSFATDGVGTSLATRRWESFPNAPKKPESVKKKATHLANAAAEAAEAAAAAARDWTTDHFDREFVSIDPGRKTTIEARRLRDPNWKYSLSTNEYYELCGVNDDRDADAREIDHIHGLRQWMSTIPAAKTATSQETLKRLRYLYRSLHFRDMMELNIDIKRRIRRWETYKRKQSFIAQVCRRLTKGLDKNKATICFGDGGFSNSSSGHRASISMQPFIDFLRREGWHVIVVSEMNTSQVCSYCCRLFEYDYMPYKVCDVGSAADGHAYFYKPASNHFVRRCSVCHAILNRDGNAARSIGYLGMLEYYKRQRPLCFTKHLQEPPAYVVRRQSAQSAQAAERAAAAFDTETPAAPVAPAPPVVPPMAGDTEVPLSNTKRRRLEHRVARSIGAELGRERKAQEVADIVASPNRYVERLVNARPSLDPAAEWARVYDKITKRANKQKEKKAASDKAKTKTKRTATTSTTEEPAPEEPAPKKAKTTTTTSEQPAPKRNSRKRNAPEEPAPEEPASKSKTKKKY
ncbi:hypothetical protein H4R27_002192 [Coemansia aciculifera]|nr:hypothetical protein H4R27_002192 [Coemansia aciculifera]